MTVRVITLKGETAGRYFTDQAPSYYLDGQEPPGRWRGRGAELLGLDGTIQDEPFLNVMAGCHPATGTRLGRRFGEDSVRGFDATFSAPKSVSVLFGVGDATVRRAVTEAHDRAVDAVIDWIEDQAVTRIRVRGHIVAIDAEGVVAGVFRQHTSRENDPQLHSHVVIANRVPTADGRWLALDARTIKLDQRTLSGLYQAGLRTELTGRLGVKWHRPEHGIAEIAGFDPAVLEHFSQRTREMEDRLQVKLERFRTGFGREPTQKELWRLGREAAVDSRPRKPANHRPDHLHQEWRDRLGELGWEPERLIATVTGHHLQRGFDAEMVAGMVDQALEALAEQQSTWRPAELVRELAATVPTEVTVDPAELAPWLQRLADRVAATRCVDLSPAAPDGVPVRRNGRPVTEMIIHRRYTTEGILDQERSIVEWVDTAAEIAALIPERPVNVPGIEALSPAQAEACFAVAGVGTVVLINGPAGAGKTTALAPAVAHLQSKGRAVFGVAPTAAAADVLATETAMPADTLDKLLHEHRQPDRPPAPGYDPPFGATVILDEAGTVSTPKLAQLVELVRRQSWRVVMVGDPRQFTAVGRGGMFGHLVDTYGAIELDQIHRFTHQWEREASLRLRNGDAAVLAEYDRHGRLHGGTPQDMETEILTAWATARARGETVAMMANTTDTVERLNHRAQQARIATGELDPTGPHVAVSDQRHLLVGDEVVTRRNDRTLRTDRGAIVKNRDHWTVDTIHGDGTVTVTGRSGTVRLPAEYTAQHVELGYAQTSHATQGRTVDTALVLIDRPTDTAGVYTPMTRGRHTNHAFVVTDDSQTATDAIAQSLGREWIDQPAITHERSAAENRLYSNLWPSLSSGQSSQPGGGDLASDAANADVEAIMDAVARRRSTRARERDRTGHELGR